MAVGVGCDGYPGTEGVLVGKVGVVEPPAPPVASGVGLGPKVGDPTGVAPIGGVPGKVAAGVRRGVTGRLVSSGVGVIAIVIAASWVAVGVRAVVPSGVGVVSVVPVSTVSSGDRVGKASPAITVSSGAEAPNRGLGSRMRSTARYQTVPSVGSLPHPRGP